MSALTYSLFKNVSTNLTKTFIRCRRIQRRKPIAVFNNFEEAAKEELMKQKLKEEKKKMPDFKKGKQQQQMIKIESLTAEQRAIYEKLQNEADRIYYKHDPYLTHDLPPDEAIHDIKQNVDMLAAKLSRSQNDLISSIMRLPDGDQRFGPSIQTAKSQRHRYEKKKILLEGKRLIFDALQSGLRIESIYMAKETQIKEFNFDFSRLDYELKFFQVSQKAISMWSDVETSQGFIAIAKMPAPGECKVERTVDLPLMLVLDQVRDPGNMGTIIRSAAAIGFEKILVTKGCVDIWDPKVIRSAMGGHFRVPIINNLAYDQITSYLPNETKLLFADSPKEDSSRSGIEKIDYSQLQEISDSAEHVTLVIGNETSGLNYKMYGSMALKVPTNNQLIVNIPLENGMESLNCAIAFTVLGYELRKVFLNK